MSTPEQRKQLKDYYRQCEKVYAANAERGYRPAISAPPMPDDLRDLQCGAKTRFGTTCKQKAIYANGRCKWHGGCSTGPNTAEGKKRSAMNGNCPKKKRTHTEIDKTRHCE